MYSFELRFAKVYKAFSSKFNAFRLDSQMVIKSLSNLPDDVGSLEKKSHSRDKYGYIRNHKKTVKNEQARTREPEEYKAEARKAKPQSKSAKKNQSRKAYLLEDKQIPSVGMYDKVAFYTNLEALGASGDVLDSFRGISEHLDEVRIEPGHEDTDFLKTTKTS
ncbi:hypothetical protein Tco_0007913 [Tanacetum coccineum]